MKASIVVITKDECGRLELAIESILLQTLVTRTSKPAEAGFELIVVNDGSSDDTRRILDDVGKRDFVTVIHNESCVGRSAARNIGAQAASGDFVLFLDGDIVCSRDLVEEHQNAHEAATRPTMVRGHNRHLRCTRFFLDPQTGTPRPGHEADVARMGKRLQRNVVTMEQIANDFASIESRSAEGLYAGMGPAKMHSIEVEEFERFPENPCLWMAASGQNMSYPRAEFLACGGFDESIDLNEHREVARTLMKRGITMRICDATSYHLLHRVGWRDPMEGDSAWEQRFYAKHPDMATELMSVFWLSVAGDPRLPEGARIPHLSAFHRACTGASGVDYAHVRHVQLGLQKLGLE